jgi:predicted nucleic acid-binding protein
LGSGERYAIALALHLKSELILMDDRMGVAAAASCGVPAVGTLRVLRLAADRGLLDFSAAVARLRATIFRIGYSCVSC